MILELTITLAKVLFIVGLTVGFFAPVLTWVERKQSAIMQDRIGANRADIMGFTALGLFHAIADAIKMFTKEDFIPQGANRFLHTLSPIIALIPAILTFAVVPFGGQYELWGTKINLVISDLDVGLLFVFAIASIATYGYVIAGWASNNNWSLLGSMRTASQMISYEVTMGLTIVGVLMVYGTMKLTEIGAAQEDFLNWGDLYKDQDKKWSNIMNIIVNNVFQTDDVQLLTVLKNFFSKRQDKIEDHKSSKSHTGKRPPRFAPGGQSTQMIVGADGSNDKIILGRSVNLYAAQKLRRVYYSAFSPIPDASAVLPLKPAPLIREHRLYQADWLLRFYGFQLDEILEGTKDDMLDMDHDPKMAWALKNRHLFPVDLNRADKNMLLRVPGLGAVTVKKILSIRRYANLSWYDLVKMRLPLNKLKPFITVNDYKPAIHILDSQNLGLLLKEPKQMELFGASE